jgi:DNA-binding MurR/RpiR family transcriptional regulator
MEALATMRKNDVLITVTLRRMSKPAAKLMEHAKELGIRSLVVSDVAGFKPQPDVVLCAHRGQEGESQSLTVPMAICNALVLEVARLDQGKSMKALADLTQLRRSLPDWS